MYVLLTGTKKNAGDFLIAHAAKRLFREFAPVPDYVELPSWRPLGEHLDLVNSAKALVLCGGPAYQPAIGWRIYPILDELDRIKVPIVSFGLGWKGIPGDDYDVEHYAFPASAEPFLQRIRSDFAYAGCRDYLTWRVLRRHGFENAWMTGCPAWYDPRHLGRDLVVPASVSQIVFTPAEAPLFRKQSVRVCRVIRGLFPDARIVCSFHRGWEADQHTKPAHAANAQAIKQEAERLGAEAWDASGSVDMIERYAEFDLHIGYRVHGHCKFLSMRKPSFLITEDGRGRGVLEAMGLPGVSGWKTVLPFAFGGNRVPSLLARRLLRRGIGGLSVNPRAPEGLRLLVAEELANEFCRFRGALAVIDATWERMHRMLRALPAG